MPREDRPNIIVIMADDMGYGDVGSFNPDSRIPTPNMDALARQGMRFTDAHSPSAVCTPTRYGVLTGRYCWRTRLKQGVTGGYDSPLIESSRLTLASMLKVQGYSTACIGKWHVGLDFQDSGGNVTHSEDEIDFSKPVRGGPVDLGFDYAYFNAACGTCSPPYGFIENDRFVADEFESYEAPCKDGPRGSGMMAQGWVTSEADVIIADKACTYIEQRSGQENPFFLYLTPNAPHEPCMEEYVPAFARGRSSAGARGDLVWLFDWLVGRVATTLEETGLEQKTLIFVTSDNGALPGDFRRDVNGGARLESAAGKREFLYETYGHKSCGEWRGYKAHAWEGGHREPLIVKWPDHVDPGTISEELVCLTDIMATCAAVAGHELDEGAAEDSCSILPAMIGNKASGIREAVVHHSSFGAFAVRKGRWKLILGTKGSGGWPTPRDSQPDEETPGQLYDMLTDPAEIVDLWEERSDVVADLTGLLDRYRDSDRSVPSRGR